MREVEGCERMLYRISRTLLRSEADCCDAVQEALMKAWQHRHRIDENRFRAYLTRILINECHNIQRLRQRTVPVTVFPERIEPETKIMELRDAVERLPEKLRLPFLLVHMEGYSSQEAASVIGITLLALKSRLKRAKKS